MTHIGFTGTRDGLTPAQQTQLAAALGAFPAGSVLHHGDCVGADATAHLLARHAGHKVVLHPPSDDRLRAFCDYDELRDEDAYLARNAVIVTESDVLLACPKQDTEQRRGGTWWTVRHARKNGVAVTILWPDGSRS